MHLCLGGIYCQVEASEHKNESILPPPIRTSSAAATRQPAAAHQPAELAELAERMSTLEQNLFVAEQELDIRRRQLRARTAERNLLAEQLGLPPVTQEEDLPISTEAALLEKVRARESRLCCFKTRARWQLCAGGRRSWHKRRSGLGSTETLRRHDHLTFVVAETGCRCTAHESQEASMGLLLDTSTTSTLGVIACFLRLTLGRLGFLLFAKPPRPAAWVWFDACANTLSEYRAPLEYDCLCIYDLPRLFESLFLQDLKVDIARW